MTTHTTFWVVNTRGEVVRQFTDLAPAKAFARAFGKFARVWDDANARWIDWTK